VTLGEAASRDVTIVGGGPIASDVIVRIWRKEGVMAAVSRAGQPRRAENVIGVITKQHVADSVAAGLKMHPR